MTPEEIQQEIDNEVAEFLSRRQIERHLASVQPPDFEVLARERYIANKAEFVQPAFADVRHILILTSDKPKEEALAKARALRDRRGRYACAHV